jgi:site-specific recombinase XerD
MTENLLEGAGNLPALLGFDTAILAGHVSEASMKMYTRDFRAYLDYAGSKDAALNTATLYRWIEHLVSNTTMSPNTINRMVSAIKKIMDIASKHQYISHELSEAFQHVEGVRAKALKARMRPHNRVKIEPDSMRTLIDSIDRSTLVGLRNAALFTTLASSGLRIKELSRLKPEQVIQRADGYLLHMYAEEGKNQEEDREANISVEAVEAIRVWLAARPIQSEYIFTSFEGKGERPLAKHITPQGAWKVVKHITEAQGLQNIKPHDFRRFVGTQLAKSKDLRIAQIALGHKRIETTAKYDLREIEVGATDKLF